MNSVQYEKAKVELKKKGFLDIPIGEDVDISSEIQRLKKEKNVVILGHYYQIPAIQDISDFVGDSLGLAQEAEKTDADIIMFCGVHFMAETAKMLNPTKKVLLPDLNAGCSLADSCPEHLFKAFKSQYPDHIVISYVNSSAELKTMTDICCTSSNAVHVINSVPKDKKIIFAPDRNLGHYLMKETGREMVLWHGVCQVHEMFSWEKISTCMLEHPEAEFIAHPECQPHVLEMAEYVGSTAGLLKYVTNSKSNEFIVATEPGIFYQMQKKVPNKKLIPAPAMTTCACNECPFMKLNTMEKIYTGLKYELPEIQMEKRIMEEGRKSIDRMLEISRRAGL